MSRRAQIRQRRQQAKRRRQLTMILIVAGAALIVAAILILTTFRAPGEVAVDYPMVDGNAMGDPDAPVTLIEYSDFQCSHCRRFHEETLPEIIENHVRTGEVYFIYRNFPFLGPESVLAANASLCAAEQGAFWRYADNVFANQTGANVGAFSQERLVALADPLDIELGEFRVCLAERRYQGEVQEQFQQGEQAGVNSTPTFFLNGKMLTPPGALPYERFRQAIEAAQQAAE